MFFFTFKSKRYWWIAHLSELSIIVLMCLIINSIDAVKSEHYTNISVELVEKDSNQ